MALPPDPEPLVLLLDSREPLQPATRSDLLEMLSAGEHQRLHAYRRQDDKELFLRARAGIRLLLAAWLGCSAAEAPIITNDYGKPFCPNGPNFNASHSGNLIVLALHPRCQVGVDVEQLRQTLEWRPIAQRVLSEPQQQALERLPTEVQQAGFLAQWCALEAELKAIGTGLSGMDNWRRRVMHDASPPVRRWLLLLPTGYVGTVAVLPD